MYREKGRGSKEEEGEKGGVGNKDTPNLLPTFVRRKGKEWEGGGERKWGRRRREKPRAGEIPYKTPLEGEKEGGREKEGGGEEGRD